MTVPTSIPAVRIHQWSKPQGQCEARHSGNYCYCSDILKWQAEFLPANAVWEEIKACNKEASWPVMLTCFPEATKTGALICRDGTVEPGLLLSGRRVCANLSRVIVLARRSPSLG